MPRALKPVKPRAPHIRPEPADPPDALYSLRFADAPDVLLREEAARLIRVDVATLDKVLLQQYRQGLIGIVPDNPLPVKRFGRCVRIPKDGLLEWFLREARA